MAEIKDIHPVAPLWPKRPVRKVRYDGDRTQDRRGEQEEERDDADEDGGDHEIDEYA